MPSLPVSSTQFAFELPIARLFQFLPREHEVQSPRQCVDQIGFDLRGKIGLLHQQSPWGGIVAPPGQEQAAVGSRVIPRPDDQRDRTLGLDSQAQRLDAAEEKVDGRAWRTVEDSPQDPANLLPYGSACGQWSVVLKNFFQGVGHDGRAHGRIEDPARFFAQCDALDAQRFRQELRGQAERDGTDAERLGEEGLGLQRPLRERGARAKKRDQC